MEEVNYTGEASSSSQGWNIKECRSEAAVCWASDVHSQPITKKTSLLLPAYYLCVLYVSACWKAESKQ